MGRSREGIPRRGLFECDPFAGFGPSRFHPSDECPASHPVRGRGESKLLALVREHTPRNSGIYGMLDSRNRLIYVGKAKNLRARLLSYFRKNSRDPKAGRILQHTRALLWEPAADEFAALLRELELIRRFRPRFNVQGQPGQRRYVYICLGKSPAAHVYLSRLPTGKEVACYGPLVGYQKASDAMRRLNDWFRLRDCPSTQRMVFADQSTLFPTENSAKCLRYDIGNCLGPCGGLCTQKHYSANVRAARAFLDGRDRTMLDTLTERMQTAASELRFEQAMALRDRLQSLTWLQERLAFLRSARRANSFIYPLTGPDERVVWYLIHHGEVQAAVREPTTPAAAATAAALIEAAFAVRPPIGGIDDRCVDSVLLVTGWFRRHPDEKPKLLTCDAALTACKSIT